MRELEPIVQTLADSFRNIAETVVNALAVSLKVLVPAVKFLVDMFVADIAPCACMGSPSCSLA